MASKPPEPPKPRPKRAAAATPRPAAAAPAPADSARNSPAPDVTPRPARVVEEQKEAARLLGVTDRTLRTWMKMPGFPSWEAGWDLNRIERWRQEVGLKGSIEDEAKQDLRRQRELEDLEQARIRTRSERNRLAVQEGELLPRIGVELWASTVLTTIADWAEQLPDLIAGVCTAECREAVRARLEQELDDKRRDLRDEFDRKAAEWKDANGGEGAS